jgi:hypothetical protein
MVRARGIHPLGVPIVSTIERCAELLKLEPGRLAAAVAAARLEPWGRHASGAPVWRWRELTELGQQLGGQVPAALAHAWRRHQYGAADRGRANRQKRKPTRTPGPGRVGG